MVVSIVDYYMNKNKIYTFDFDSTFIKVEGFDELARIVVKNNPSGKILINEICTITKLGMDGKISYPESLKRRFSLLKPNIHQINEVIQFLKTQITESFIRNKAFFCTNKDQIYIVSGGFKEWIVPIVMEFGITKDHVLANTFKFDGNGLIIGFDENNLLAQNNGKAKAIRELHLDGEINVIGDSFTDYEIKRLGIAQKFFLFTENIRRKHLVDLADYCVNDLDEFLVIEREIGFVN